MTEYRIVKRWQPFFSRWYYNLEKKEVTRFLWWKFENWENIGGNTLDTSIPPTWKEFCNNEPIIENP
jgi:hypothetical protein